MERKYLFSNQDMMKKLVTSRTDQIEAEQELLVAAKTFRQYIDENFVNQKE